ncbi:MAG: molybdopterin molybdotransferase MoeA [Oxalobacter sp.]|nr:molybdopterin molybdotransferase MoeA [Oxalobacter sp.]
MNGSLMTMAELTASLPSYNPDAISVKMAHDLIAGFVTPVSGIERLPLRYALGRVLAEDVVSPVSVPGFDNAAMDGFAFCARDANLSGPLALEVVGYAYAGHPYRGDIGDGECIRIMTGAPVPGGCDTVVQQEHVEMAEDETHVVIPAGTVTCGDNIRKAGENLREGATVLAEGTVLRPAHLGLLASAGLPDVAVRRKVRVALFSTGDELRTAGMELDTGAVYDSNRTVLAGLMERLGCEVLDMGIIGDDRAELEKALQNACRNADAIVTSGGVSVGVADYTKQVMASMGDVVFWSVKMRPGRPMAFGRIHAGGDHACLFGLPGNPVAVMVSFYFFVRDALMHMMGALLAPLVTVRAQAATNFSKRVGRTEFQRGVLSQNADGNLTVRTTGEQGSGILRSMAEANAIVVLPEEGGTVRAGEWVDVVLLEGLV